MGTLIAFVFPSTMFLHVVTEKTSARFVAKLVFGLGLIFFVAGTYTVLTTQEESSHHQVDIHPPGIDPIKPVDFHNPLQSKTNDSVLHVSVREAPVDVDIAKIGLGQDKNVGKDEKRLNDAKPAEKPIVATVNEGLMEAENVVRPADGEVKRQEPPVPHAPQDIPLEKKDNEEPLKNEKRQLMSKEDEKSSNVDSVEEKTNNVNAGSKKAIKVSEQEIDEELKKLEQTNKVPTDASKESDSKDSAKVNHVLNEAKSSQNVQDKTLVKRELELSQNLEIKGEKRQDNMRNDDIIVLQQNGNQTNLQDKGVSNQVNQDTLESRDYSPRERVLAANHSMPLTEETPKEEDTVKIRDLKSNSRPVEKRSSPISSRSMKSFLSKQRSRHPRRS